MVRETDSSVTDEVTFSSDQLYIYYERRTGVPPDHNYTTFQLSERLSAAVDNANGNLIVKSRQLSIAGTGLSLIGDYYYNNLAEGTGWSQTARLYQGVYQNYDSPFVYYYGLTGDVESFRKNADGTFTSPPGLDAVMTQPSTGEIIVTFRHPQLTYTFQGTGPGSDLYLTSITDQNGNALTFTYDNIYQPNYQTSAKLESVTDTRGRTLTYSYGSTNQPTQMTDSTGRTWAWARNQWGEITSYTDPLGQVTGFAYDSNGNLTQITTRGGRTTNITYANGGSSFDRVASVTQVTNTFTGAGDTTRFAYQSPIGPCLSTDYGETVVTDPNGHQTTFCTDPLDRPRVAYDPLGHQKDWTYDVDGDVLQYATGTGSTITNASYDQNDSPISLTDPTSVTTTVNYGDSLHPYYPTSVTDGQGSTLRYAYYASGQPGAGTGGGNLKTITDNSDPNPLYTFTYNPNGTIAAETDQAGNQASYSYDAKGELTKVTPPAGGIPADATTMGATSYVPDALSRVASMTDANGNTTSYTYDALDRLTQIKYGDGSTITYTYDPDGNLIKRVDSAGVPSQGTGTQTWAYDQKNRVTQITLPGGQTSSYTYDPANNLTSLSDGTGTTTYGYDANELTSLAIPGGSCTSNPTSGCATFAYDANGNRTTANLPNGVTVAQSADADGHVLSLQAKNTSGTVRRPRGVQRTKIACSRLVPAARLVRSGMSV